ncbi:DNA-formamidopyrimidine glycosylase [Dictyobacter arantiisoli]|uniref:Formamidopyrimidine-DNA glycosylase n=1 Tax=Dictyobacter arantiisoli TaxID=2014874 RepID=A0A5A5TK03_9CHLR|nr:DNA-formamidopyrimidine glycosylase [Dictyobacter arantiisoli]GCF11359.1 formamidopyrimidine-DNA glycosylase [Dictyobacter arantiisoli]
MPELPEVEYTARQLRASVVGATIREALVFWERTISHPAVPDFLAEVAGRRIEGVRRRGKFLLMDLSGDLFLSIHRRMTGNFLLLPAGWSLDMSLKDLDAALWSTKGPLFTFDPASGLSYSHELRYCRVCFIFEDGRCLLFTDPRKFGKVGLWGRALEQEALHGLGPEPFSEDFSLAHFTAALSGRRTNIKQLLLDQTVVAGVGNIYADEALFYASLHPTRRADSLSDAEIALLHKGIVEVLTRGIEHGGTSFNDYRDLWGEAGENFNHVHVYHQDGKPCSRCGTLIERMVIGQRSAHFCPHCQPAPLLATIPLASE